MKAISIPADDLGVALQRYLSIYRFMKSNGWKESDKDCFQCDVRGEHGDTSFSLDFYIDSGNIILGYWNGEEWDKWGMDCPNEWRYSSDRLEEMNEYRHKVVTPTNDKDFVVTFFEFVDDYAEQS